MNPMIWSTAMRYVAYSRMADFIVSLDDDQLTEEQRKFKIEITEILRVTKHFEELDNEEMVE